MRRVEIDADLVIEGEGLTARLTGDGPTVNAVVSGRLGGPGRTPRDVRRRLPALARRLQEAGVRVELRDTAGRRLGEVGAGVRSRLGRLAAGSSSVRLSRRLIARLVLRR